MVKTFRSGEAICKACPNFCEVGRVTSLVLNMVLGLHFEHLCHDKIIDVKQYLKPPCSCSQTKWSSRLLSSSSSMTLDYSAHIARPSPPLHLLCLHSATMYHRSIIRFLAIHNIYEFQKQQTHKLPNTLYVSVFWYNVTLDKSEDQLHFSSQSKHILGLFH